MCVKKNTSVKQERHKRAGLRNLKATSLSKMKLNKLYNQTYANQML